jgi:hypothetical protein
MGGTVPPLPNTPSLRGAQGEHKDNFTFTFTLLHDLNDRNTDHYAGYQLGQMDER